MIDRFSPFSCPFMICAMWVIFAFENLSVVLYISSARVSLSADDLVRWTLGYLILWLVSHSAGSTILLPHHPFILAL